MRVTHVRLLVADYTACFRFYSNVMDLKAGFGDENSGYADFEAGDGVAFAVFDRLDMAQVAGTAHLPTGALTQDHAMRIFEANDCDEQVGVL